MDDLHETEDFDATIKSYLKESFEEDGSIIGFFEDPDLLNTIFMKMKNWGYTYSIRDSTSNHRRRKETMESLNNNDRQSSQLAIFFHLKVMSIKFFGYPFSVEKTTHYQCTHGCKYYKSKSERKRENGEPRKRKDRGVMSKKLGCQAKMTLKKIIVYPDYSLDSIKDWRHKKKVIEKLRENLKQDVNDVKKLNRYYLSVSIQSRHNHPPYTYTMKVSHTPMVNTIYVANEDDIATWNLQSKEDPQENEIPLVHQTEETFNQEEAISPPCEIQTIQCTTPVDLRILFKEKLKRLYTMADNCSNPSLLLKLLSDLEQIDESLVNDIGYEDSIP